MSFRDLAWVVLDLETSGGRPIAHWDRQGRFRPAAEITEVGLVQGLGPLRQGSFTSLCAIEGPLPRFITHLTGISTAMLVDAPPWSTLVEPLTAHLEGRLWVAHHAAFDGAFLQAYLPEAFWSRHHLICTLKLAKHLIPEAPNRSLSSLSAILGLRNRCPHRALPDAEATAELFQILLQRAEAQGWDLETLLKRGHQPWKV